MAIGNATFGNTRPSTNGHAKARPLHSKRIVGNKWLVSLPVMLAALTAVLDASIVNVALPNMQSSFGSSVDEIDWIITGYLISNVIVIPATGWLSGTFGLRRYFVASQILFLVGSVLCGLSWNLGSLVFFRILQGIGGGAILPVTLTLMLEAFPPEEFGMASALYGIGAVLGPAIGPTLGGYLTDTFSWPAIFFINVPLVILSIVLTQLFVHEVGAPQGAGKVDFLGLGSVAVWLGTLQVVLQEGEKNGWFESPFILTLTCISLVSFVTFIYAELTVERPLINIRIFKDRDFAAGSIGGAILGASLFGSVFIIPLFAGTLLHYTALQIGLLLLPTSLLSLALFPVAGQLGRLLDPRIMMAIGTVLMVASMLANGFLTTQSSFTQIMLLQLLRGAALPFLFTSIGQLALTKLAPAQKADASSLYNLTRTLGGSIGIALIGTMIVDREKFHFERFGESVTQFALATRERLAGLTSGFASGGVTGVHTASQQANAALSAVLMQQSYVAAFDDASLALAVAGLLMFVMLPIFQVDRKVRASSPVVVAE
jgi:MFS transporter, DHA2 family, multidrug resistance protein